MDDERLLAAVLDRDGAVPTAALPERHDETAQLFGLLVAAVVVTVHGDSAATADAVGSVLGRWRSADELAAADPADLATSLGASVEGGEGAAVDDAASDLVGALHDLATALGDLDLPRLRADADGDPDALAARLATLPGLDDAAAEAFVREVAVRWPELQPYVGDTALRAARELGVADDTAGLAARAGGPDEVRRLGGALARLARDGAYAEIRERAAT
ncbi:hypothetical protein [Actinomycetospora soli]|uniref:hypothetical protein n=1 Tax=Actinomycetospora soli TaxID=2893887 RepID=UPI001E456F33|nr:hypothetical protein [Actinomycetospora soli]MCD2186955.1 hypothetical protein [Actinomycetospora soli]